MIGRLTGTVIDIFAPQLTLDVNGVGYELICSTECLRSARVGEPLTVTVFTELRQDSLRLYGFVDRAERKVFSMLVLVPGVGAKSALGLVSGVGALELLRAIGAGEVSTLQRVKGVGRRTAERLVVELKERVGELVDRDVQLDSSSKVLRSSAIEDAALALQSLGFSENQARLALQRAKKEIGAEDGVDASDLIRVALKHV
jgi:Holliday junction DNA helicase RuvA